MTNVITLPNRKPRRHRSPEIASQAIYDGRQHVGDVIERQSGQYEAALANGRSLGLYNGAEAAAHAILLVRHKGAG